MKELNVHSPDELTYAIKCIIVCSVTNSIDFNGRLEKSYIFSFRFY